MQVLKWIEFVPRRALAGIHALFLDVDGASIALRIGEVKPIESVSPVLQVLGLTPVGAGEGCDDGMAE
jgi:hypothetical protein